MSTFHDRLLLAYAREQARRKEAGEKRLTYTDIWTAAETTSGAATHWFKGVNGMDLDTCVKVAPVLRCNPRWLFDEECEIDDEYSGDLSPSSNGKQENPGAIFDLNVKSSALGMRIVPVISYIQAGQLTEISDPFSPGQGFATEICDDDLGPSAFALEIDGESMLPDFRPGDRIIIDPDIVPNPGDFVVAKNGADEATFKKYRPRGAGADGRQVFELVPLNDDYPTLRSDTDSLRIIGTMVEHRKKFRRK
jgi:SOS-response transcriptional repressor LexA